MSASKPSTIGSAMSLPLSSAGRLSGSVNETDADSIGSSHSFQGGTPADSSDEEPDEEQSEAGVAEEAQVKGVHRAAFCVVSMLFAARARRIATATSSQLRHNVSCYAHAPFRPVLVRHGWCCARREVLIHCWQRSDSLLCRP